MTLFDHYLEYMTQLLEGRRSPPEGITLPEGDVTEKAASLSRQLSADRGATAFVRACAHQDGVTLPEENLPAGGLIPQAFSSCCKAPYSLAPIQEASPAEEPSETAPDPDAGKHAFEVFLDCVALDDGLVQYLMEVLQKRDWKEFYKLSQITTKLDLDPEEFLYWLGNKELYVDEEERSCAVIMDACLERLRQEGQLELIAALLSGDRRTFELFRCQAPELQHLPAATYEWYSKNYLDRDYPIRMLMKCRGIRFPEHIPGNESK